MAFAPAFHQNNNDWLNELVGDIVEPGRSGHRRETSAAPLQDGGLAVGDWKEEEPLPSPISEADAEYAWDQIPSSPPRYVNRRPSHSSIYSRIGALSPWSHNRAHSRSRSRSQSTQNERAAARSPSFSRPAESRISHQTPIPEYPSDLIHEDEEYLPASKTQRDTPTSRPVETPETGAVRAMHAFHHGYERMDSPTSPSPFDLAEQQRRTRPNTRMTDTSAAYCDCPPTSQLRVPPTARIHYRVGSALSQSTTNTTAQQTTYTTKNADGKLIPRAPPTQAGSFLSSQRSTSLIRSASRASIASTYHGGFPQHPGVRPLEEREVLGEAAGPTDEDHEYPAPIPLALIIIGITLSVFIISVNRNVVATAIPEITARFHSYEDIGWYGSAYLLTASAFQPLYGRIYMAFDTKWSYLLAVGVFELGSFLCGISPTSDALIIGRAIQGLGSAGILTGAFVVGTHSVRLQVRPILFAGVGVLYGAGALCGPMLGGAFTDYLSWRWCFYINLPIGLVTFVCVFLFFKPQGHAVQRPPFLKRLWHLDWVGNIILLGACTQLFLALELSEAQYSWSSAPCIGLICGFGVTAMLFIAWMFYKKKDALIPIHIAKQRTVAASCGAAFFIYGATLLHSYYLPIWFQAVKGVDAVISGVDLVPYMVVNAFFSLFAGIFVSRNGLFAPPAIIGCAIGCVGAGLLATLQPDTPTAKWAGFEVLVAAGLGMAIQQGFSAVQTALPLHEVPIGTAAVVASQSLGGAIFVSVGNTLLQDHLFNENQANAIPGVNIRAVVELGATEFRKTVPADALPALIMLYNKALQAALVAAVPLCGMAFLCSLCMEWRSVRRAPPGEKEVSPEKVLKEKIEHLPDLAEADNESLHQRRRTSFSRGDEYA